VKNFVRNRDFFKIPNLLETGAEHGMYTFQRYRNWLDKRGNWALPGQSAETPDEELAEAPPPSPALPKFLAATPPPKPEKHAPASNQPPSRPSSTRIEIEPTESEFGKILKRPGE
jgi:twitching motility protein PilT